MLKKQLLGLVIILSFIAYGNALLAQGKPAKKKKEKIMIYDGENLKLQLYGFVTANFVYNSANVRHEPGPFFVENQKTMQAVAITGTPYDNFAYGIPKTNSEVDGAFHVDVRKTRLGLKLTGPKAILDAKTSGAVEIDFLGQLPNSGSSAWKPELRIRHAYGKIEFPWKTFLIIGQYWSLVTPHKAFGDIFTGLTGVPFGRTGVLLLREQQLLVGQKVGSKTFNVIIEGAISRVMSGDDPGPGNDPLSLEPYLYPGPRDAVFDNIGPGEATQTPGLRGKVTVNIIPMDMLKIMLGCTTHYQVEKHALTLVNAEKWGWITGVEQFIIHQAGRFGKRVPSHSYGAFAKISVSLVTLVAAGFTGSNIDSFIGGLGEGVVESKDSSNFIGVRSRGGYLQAQFDLRKIAPIPFKINAGYGTEVKSNRNSIAAGKILWNKIIQANVWWFLNDYLQVGFEVAQHQTKYKRTLGVSEDMRYHGAMKFSF